MSKEQSKKAVEKHRKRYSSILVYKAIKPVLHELATLTGETHIALVERLIMKEAISKGVNKKLFRPIENRDKILKQIRELEAQL